MESKYTVIRNNVKINTIRRNTDNAFIPPVTDNMDYVEYLKWVEDGNVAPIEDQNV